MNTMFFFTFSPSLPPSLSPSLLICLLLLDYANCVSNEEFNLFTSVVCLLLLLAVTLLITITSIGQPGLECHFSHDNNSISVPVLQLQFVENKVRQFDHTH